MGIEPLTPSNPTRARPGASSDAELLRGMADEFAEVRDGPFTPLWRRREADCRRIADRLEALERVAEVANDAVRWLPDGGPRDAVERSLLALDALEGA